MSWDTDVLVDFVADQVGGAVGASRVAWNIYRDAQKIQNSSLPQSIKDAAVILIIVNEIGNPLPNDIPATIETAYDLIYNTPDFVGGISKQELWNQLHQIAPEEFPQDIGGWLTPQDTLSGLENKPRVQNPIDDLPENLPPPASLAAPRSLFSQAPQQQSPLVIDLDGDGIELTSFNATTTGTFFDLDADGYAQQTAWIATDDALLARDVNENGKIDDVSELFGSPSVDGFALLANLDSNHDLIIDNNDDAWESLLIWQDANGDAISQSGELTTLDVAGIKNIRLDTVNVSTDVIAGNDISHTASFTWNDNSAGSIVDAWFVNDKMNSYYIGDFTLNPETLALPTLRGFGSLPDLHIAMSMDEDLLEMVTDFEV